MSLTKVTYSMIENAALDVTNYGADSTGVDDSTAAIQAAIDAAGAADGNVVYLPAGTYKITDTLDIPYTNVVIVGNGSGQSHDTGTSSGTTATRLLWAGAAGGKMVSINSPSGASNQKKTGCGVKGIMFDAQGAGTGLEILSQSRGAYSDLFFAEFSTACVSMNVVASLGEAKDPQSNMFDTISCRQLLTTGSCFVFSGDSVSNASMNLFQNIDLSILNGNGFVFNNSDNNLFIRTRVYTGGTGLGILFNGSNTALNQVARGNTFIYYTSNASTVGKGTPSFTYPSNNNSIYYLDEENGTPFPTIETGSSVWFSVSNNMQIKLGSSQACFADNYTDALAQRLLFGTESLRIYNASQNHIRVLNSVSEWSVRIDSGGNMSIAKISGTGYLQLPAADGTALQIGGQFVTVDAPDSAGVGYRALRLPN